MRATPIPVTKELKEQVEKDLKKKFSLTEVDPFINMFNSKVLDPKNLTVSDMANNIQNAYKNIVMLNGKLVVETDIELGIKNSIRLLEDWNVLINIKRLAGLLINEDYDPETKIVFTDDKAGVPMVEIVKEDGRTLLERHWASEKVVAKTEDIANNIFAGALLKDYNEEGTACYFDIADIIDIDDSFVLEVEKMILKSSFADDKKNKENKPDNKPPQEHPQNQNGQGGNPQ